MNHETMNVHKALCELKTLNARIIKEINETTFVVANKHSNQKINGESVQDYIARTREQYQSIKSLIARRNAIKQAVTRANAVTKVTIDGTEYTVAEAIDMKSIGIDHLKALLLKLEAQYGNAQHAANRANGDPLDNRADEYIKVTYGSTDLKNMSEEMRKSREAFIAAQTTELVDPIKAADEIKALRDKIDAFLSEVDSALSVSNAITNIIVQYETT